MHHREPSRPGSAGLWPARGEPRQLSEACRAALTGTNGTCIHASYLGQAAVQVVDVVHGRLQSILQVREGAFPRAKGIQQAIHVGFYSQGRVPVDRQPEKNVLNTIWTLSESSLLGGEEG